SPRAASRERDAPRARRPSSTPSVELVVGRAGRDHGPRPSFVGLVVGRARRWSSLSSPRPEVVGTVTGFRRAQHGFARSAVGSLNLRSRRRPFVPHGRLLPSDFAVGGGICQDCPVAPAGCRGAPHLTSESRLALVRRSTCVAPHLET